MNKEDFPYVLNRTIVNIARQYEIDRLELTYYLIVTICSQFIGKKDSLQDLQDLMRDVFNYIQENEPDFKEVLSLKPQKIDN